MTKEIIAVLAFDAIIFTVALILYFRPPKQRNLIYGYRTKRSLESIENWRFAQAYFAKQWMSVFFLMIINQLLLVFVGNVGSNDEAPPIILIVSLVDFIIGTLLCAFATEYTLKKLNGEN